MDTDLYKEPTKIEEDNQACVYASESKHMARNLRHLDLAQLWFKEKVADGTCVIVKVDSKENNSDIGTQRVSKIIFDYLTHNLIDKSLRTNIFNLHTHVVLYCTYIQPYVHRTCIYVCV